MTVNMDFSSGKFHENWIELLDDNTRKQVKILLKEFPASMPTLNAIAACLLHRTETSDITKKENSQSKKRKIEFKQEIENGSIWSNIGEPLLIFHDLSFQIPRKKMDFLVCRNAMVVLSLNNGKNASNLENLLTDNQATLSNSDLSLEYTQNRTVELIIPNTGIKYLMCLPTPNKTQKNISIVMIYSLKNSFSCSSEKSDSQGSAEILFGFNENDKASLKITSFYQEIAARYESNKQTFLEVLSECSEMNVDVIEPKKSDFISQFPSTHSTSYQRAKNPEQLYASCHIGSKEGYLYFLSNGIFFGFKKPLIFIPFEKLESFEVENITTRTFDIRVTFDGVTKVFSMIDQCEFQPIMNYAKKYRLDQVKVGGLTMEQVNSGKFAKDAKKSSALKTNSESSEVSDEENDEDYQVELSEGESDESIDSEDSEEVESETDIEEEGSLSDEEDDEEDLDDDEDEISLNNDELSIDKYEKPGSLNGVSNYEDDDTEIEGDESCE